MKPHGPQTDTAPESEDERARRVERQARIQREARGARIISFVVGLPPAVAGAMLMLSALGWVPFFRLRASTGVAFFAGLAFFLLGSLFVAAAFPLKRAGGLFNGVYKVAMGMFLVLAHYTVFFGKSTTLLVIGSFVLGENVQLPLVAYLVLAFFDGMIAWWYLFGRKHGVNKAFSEQRDVVRMLALAALFFALMLLAAYLGLINPAARGRLFGPT